MFSKGGDCMVINLRVTLVLVIIGAAIVMMVSTAFAQGNPTLGQTRPGCGNGDKNHVHTGPPGQSVRAGNQMNFSSSITIIAEKGAKVVVNIFNGISQMFHFSA